MEIRDSYRFSALKTRSCPGFLSVASHRIEHLLSPGYALTIGSLRPIRSKPRRICGRRRRRRAQGRSGQASTVRRQRSAIGGGGSEGGRVTCEPASVTPFNVRRRRAPAAPAPRSGVSFRRASDGLTEPGSRLLGNAPRVILPPPGSGTTGLAQAATLPLCPW
jgi:hypothetical protein